ncbi:hypothetical protein QQ045_013417 [Rhodiola kirilowii]
MWETARTTRVELEPIASDIFTRRSSEGKERCVIGILGGEIVEGSCGGTKVAGDEENNNAKKENVDSREQPVAIEKEATREEKALPSDDDAPEVEAAPPIEEARRPLFPDLNEDAAIELDDVLPDLNEEPLE